MSASHLAISEAGRGEAAIKTLLVTDLVDSTRMVAELGDVQASRVAIRHDREARDLARRFNGLEIDKADGFLLLFDRPIDAVGYALTYHRMLASLSQELGVYLQARAGIHLGEVMLHQNAAGDVARGAKPIEVEGIAKPTTARIMSLAVGHQTLLTRAAFDLARRSAVGTVLQAGPVSWQAHGLYRFKGVDEPLEIFEVGAVGAAPLSMPQDTEKAHRILAGAHEPILGWRPAPDQPVSQRPNWILNERIGSGGFGEVWLATQQKTGEQRVFKFCLEANRLRSLQREVTLFRLLKETLGHRDDIARVLDWNFEQAPYFLELEYTEGGNLQQWAEEQGGISAVPMAVRLELVAQAAEALAAAHSVGVLHKDIKPTNILVTEGRDGRPRVRLTDFGIGRVDDRVLAEHGITQLGMTEVLGSDDMDAVTGTFAYMAPEVFEGKAATIQADIYALGIILYQMVAGNFSHPLAEGWRRDVTDEILADDIEKIVDGTPERRPSSASEVADRLHRLEQRRAEVEKRRAQDKAYRRRKLIAGVGGVATLFLLVVSVLAVQATQARREADLRRDQAEDLIEFMLGDLRRKLTPIGRLDILSEIGDKALEYFAAVPHDDLTDEELLRNSQAMEQIGRVRHKEGNSRAAMEAFQRSLNLARQLTERDPSRVEWQEGLARRHFWIGRILWDQRELGGALEQFQTQLAINQRLAESSPEDLELQLDVAFANTNIGFIQQERGDLRGALEAFRSGIEVKRLAAEQDPGDTRRQLSLAKNYNFVGWVLVQLGDLPGALDDFYRDQAIALQLVASDPANTLAQEQLAHSHNYVGRALLSQGDLDGAREQFLAHLEIAQALVEIEPARTGWQRHLAISHFWVGNDFLARGKWEAALQHAREAEAILAHLVTVDDATLGWQRDLAMAHIGVGKVLVAASRTDGALDQAEAARLRLQPLVAKNPQDRRSQRWLSESFALEASALSSKNETEPARAAWQRAAEILEPFARDAMDPDFVEPWAKILSELGRVEEADSAGHKLAGIRRGAASDLD
ncbi:MAG: protein kinase [Acidobacteriota bacterium]